jgi:hypothetical protein
MKVKYNSSNFDGGGTKTSQPLRRSGWSAGWAAGDAVVGENTRWRGMKPTGAGSHPK